jgi:hypothetical protein
MTLGLKQDDNLSPKNPCICECGSIYKYRQGLWRHKKNCDSRINSDSSKNLNNDSSEVKILADLIKDVVKQNQEVVKQNQEVVKQNQDLTNKIIDICSKTNNTCNTSNTINNSNIHSNNKTINLQLFLNNTCKNAMNISDFVSQVQISINDLEQTGELGYAEGISKIIIKNLNDIYYTDRPIHCSDSKRETLYIKEDNKWFTPLKI